MPDPSLEEFLEVCRERDALLAVLSRLEWRCYQQPGEPCCPECRGYRDEGGHRPGCALAAALGEGLREL